MQEGDGWCVAGRMFGAAVGELIMRDVYLLYFVTKKLHVSAKVINVRNGIM